MKRPQCNCCRFWELDASTIDRSDPDWGYGDCRRRPPVIADSMIAAKVEPPRYDRQIDLDKPTATVTWDATLWPVTFATEWCGEFADPVEDG